jgi:uncharacterized membrane protein YgaE (UPF0421/DUF939 family)
VSWTYAQLAALAWGLDVPNADWMPVAALVAMKGALEQSTLVALQWLAGATIGAIVAAIFLTSVQNTKALLAGLLAKREATRAKPASAAQT